MLGFAPLAAVPLCALPETAAQAVAASAGAATATAVGFVLGSGAGASAGGASAVASGASVVPGRASAEGAATALAFPGFVPGAGSASGAAATIAVGFRARAMPPDADIVAGTWRSSLGGALWEAVNEEYPDASDFIYPPYGEPATCELHFTPPPPPLSRQNHRIAYALKATAPSEVLYVRLYCGATLLGEWTHTGESGVFEHEFDGSLVTDYADLRLELEAA